MASKTRAILLAVVLLTAGLAGCADTDDTGTDDTTDRDTGDRDTGDRDTGDRDTGERDTGDGNQTGDRNDTGTRDTQMEDFNKTFEDTIDEEGYQRNWTFPVNDTQANLTIEANLQGDAVDDFEATLWDADQEEVCTVSDDGTDTGTGGTGGIGADGQNRCQQDTENTGEYTLKVWGNSTTEDADYTINVTVEYGNNNQTGEDGTTGGQDDRRTESNDQDDGIYSVARP